MNDPVLIAYSVKQSASGKNIWTRIGAVFPHEQGAGLTLVLDAMPLGRRVILLEPFEASELPLSLLEPEPEPEGASNR